MMEANMAGVAESAVTQTGESFVGYSVDELLRDFGMGSNE
jgi:hypothetical protein